MCSSRTRKHLMGFLILAILLCEMCFFLQSADTSSFCVQTTQSTKHVTHAQISNGSKVIYEERISKTPNAGAESFCKSEQRTLQSFIRRLVRLPFDGGISSTYVSFHSVFTDFQCDA